MVRDDFMIGVETVGLETVSVCRVIVSAFGEGKKKVSPVTPPVTSNWFVLGSSVLGGEDLLV